MSGACNEIRDRLIAAEPGAVTDDLLRHLDRCPDCRRFAERARAARDYLRAHHAGVQPDPAFATRVAARLPEDAAGVLGWAALRVIPATLVLILVLGWFAIRPPAASPTAAEQAAPTEDLVALIQALGEEAVP
jgi:hypothetical protein